MDAADAMKQRFAHVKRRISQVVGPHMFKGHVANGVFRPVTDVGAHVHRETTALVGLLKVLDRAWTIVHNNKASKENALFIVQDLQRWQSDPHYWLFARHVLVVEGCWKKLQNVSGTLSGRGPTLKQSSKAASAKWRKKYGTGPGLEHGSSFADTMEGVGDVAWTATKEGIRSRPRIFRRRGDRQGDPIMI